MLDIIVRSIYLLGSKRALGLALGELGLEKLSFTIKSVALPLLFAPAKMVLGWDSSVQLGDKPKHGDENMRATQPKAWIATRSKDLRYSGFKGGHSNTNRVLHGFPKSSKTRPGTGGWKAQEHRLGWPLGGDVVSNFSTKGRLDYTASQRTVQLSDFQGRFHGAPASNFSISLIKVLSCLGLG